MSLGGGSPGLILTPSTCNKQGKTLTGEHSTITFSPLHRAPYFNELRYNNDSFVLDNRSPLNLLGKNY